MERELTEMELEKCRTPNERFHASGGVVRPKGSANLQVLCPAQTAVSRRLREAATTLGVSGGQRSGQLNRKITLVTIK
jgi:hypothetical protein